ncbi:hypothetical protein [Mesorhizobium sp. 43Arga]
MPLAATPAGLTTLLIVPLLINAAIAVVMINDSSIVSLTAPTSQAWQLSLAKAGLGLVLTLVFMIAFFTSRWAGFGTVRGMLAGAVFFSVAGTLSGLATASVRAAFGNTSAVGVSVVMHTGGFVIAYFVGLLAWRSVRRSFPDLTVDHAIEFRPSTLTESCMNSIQTGLLGIVIAVTFTGGPVAAQECDAFVGRLVSSAIAPEIEKLKCEGISKAGLDKPAHHLNSVCYTSNGPTSELEIIADLTCKTSDKAVFKSQISETVKAKAQVNGVDCKITNFKIETSGALAQLLLGAFKADAIGRTKLQEALDKVCK